MRRRADKNHSRQYMIDTNLDNQETSLRNLRRGMDGSACAEFIRDRCSGRLTRRHSVQSQSSMTRFLRVQRTGQVS